MWVTINKIIKTQFYEKQFLIVSLPPFHDLGVAKISLTTRKSVKRTMPH